jgi:hypothetical protein
MDSRVRANAKAEARRRSRLSGLRVFAANVLRNEISTMKTKSPDWIVSGGKEGALGTCTRCGDTLKIGLPQSLTVLAASVKAFVKKHSDCPEEPQA